MHLPTPAKITTAKMTATRPIGRSGWLLITLVSSAAAISLAAACWAAIVYASARERESLLAPSALLMLAASLVQLVALYRAWHDRVLDRLAARAFAATFWRRLLTVTAVAYVVALAIGPRPNLVWAWGAAVAVAFALLLLPLAAAPSVLDHWRQWSESRFGRRISWLIPATLALAFVAEVGLRVQRVADEQGWFTALMTVAADDTTDSATEVDADFQYIMASDRIRSGPFRVAVATTLDATDIDESGYVARLRHRFPGLEIVGLPVAPNLTCRAASDLAARAEKAEADLLLVVLPVCELVTREPGQADWFDWRQLELVRRLGRSGDVDARSFQPLNDDFEAFLGRLAPQLTACRAPLSGAMHARWKQSQRALDVLAVHCRGQQLPLALVLVPGEFQVNTRLTETLARRSGMPTHEVDLGLPQRKWAAFAESRNLPLVDLLPSLRLCREGAYRRNQPTWSTAGDAAAGDAIGGWLESRYGGQLAVAAQLTSSP